MAKYRITTAIPTEPQPAALNVGGVDMKAGKDGLFTVEIPEGEIIKLLRSQGFTCELQEETAKAAA